MPGHDIIVAGASAGGVEALTQLVGGLPAHLPAAVFIVLHVPAHGTSMLPRILSKAGPLPAAHPQDGEAIQPGRVYVASPDHHLLLKDGTVHLARGPRENGHRPAVDALFRSAARAYGSRVVGVVLSGALDDGTAGLAAVKQRGGLAVVQDPDEALCAGMPRSALANVQVDYCLPLADIPPVLARLAHEPANSPKGAGPVADDLEVETDLVEMDLATLHSEERAGTPAGFGCPDCGGALWELKDSALVRFRCRVGHAWSGDSLLARQSGALDTALWSALRALEESAALSRRLAVQARQRGYQRAAASFEAQVLDCEQHAATIRRVLLDHRTVAPPEPESDKPAAGEQPTTGGRA